MGKSENQSAVGVNLFGDTVVLPSGRRGRPAHCWALSTENMVTMGCALGLSDGEIAQGIGVSLPTLRKYYFSALQRRDMHRTRYELWRAAKLAELGDCGNVGALKELEKTMLRFDRLAAEKKLRDAVSEPEAVGKKEQARRAAKTAAAGDNDLTPGLWH
ncbi:hypothetical protein [Pararhodobacter zhoushanensis]|uniref:hypothetical protein n=1 Tax=Pararhodobacter zhoushanensis TaxID=2479545 RepID=UPI001FE4797E|nr:hypothetical protein [Pararhodobacter zhoushanensis]